MEQGKHWLQPWHTVPHSLANNTHLCGDESQIRNVIQTSMSMAVQARSRADAFARKTISQPALNSRPVMCLTLPALKNGVHIAKLLRRVFVVLIERDSGLARTVALAPDI